MADFSFMSDSDGENAVEELLSQAMDHCVLEQVAAINCSGFSSDSILPTHLETRFRKLKSFPAAEPKSPHLSYRNNSASLSFNSQIPSAKPQFDKGLKDSVGAKAESDSHSDGENEFVSSSGEVPAEKKGLKSKSSSGFGYSPSKSSNSSTGNAIFSPSKQNPDGKKGQKLTSGYDSVLSPLNSRNSSWESLSPPQKSGCFWCSPKKVSKKKSIENRIAGLGFDWGKNDEVLSDLNTFSAKEQQKMLKKMMKEEQKISREAEKIVKWAKQASARMDVSGIEDELSDNESRK